MRKAIFVLTIIVALAQIGDSGLCLAQQGLTLVGAGLRNSDGSRRLSERQLRKVLDSLRHKTGFLEMRFDESGFLRLGDRARFVGGSATARELLIAAVDGPLTIELEAHDNSPQIAFARLTAATVYTSLLTKTRIEARQAQLDFADFAELRGEREAVAAFDLGFAILHELVHGALGLEDAVGETAKLGPCDEVVNLIRRELSLPERQDYSARTHSVMRSSAGATKLAELVFVRKRADSGRARNERFYLRWDARRVASI